MIEIQVALGERAYPVRIGSWRDWELRGLQDLTARPWALVSDTRVWKSWGQDLQAAFATAGIETSPLLLGAGEAAKTHQTLFHIYDHLFSRRIRRDGVIAVFGGGVLGDVVGFAAATYLRGVRYVQIPSTLLAQVDSSVGGKTGLNYAGYKNTIGAFHQPSAVLISPEWLLSLPEREFRAGLAEVIKCGIIGDPKLLEILEDEEPDRLVRSPRLEEVIARAVAAKATVVAQDERDQGLRAILNFGHTIGHALEAVTGFERYLHGEAVAIGIVAALQLSVAEAGLPAEQARRIESLLEAYGLPTRAPEIDVQRILQALPMDKKADSRGSVWVLTPRMGEANVSSQIPVSRVHEAVAYVLTP